MSCAETGLCVLHCIHDLEGGGAEKQLCLLEHELNELGVKSTTAFVRGEITDPTRRLVRIQRHGKWDLGLYRRFCQLISELRPALVHIWLPPAVTIPAMLAARRHRCPVVFSYRNRLRVNDLPTAIELATALVCARGVVSNVDPQSCGLPHRLLFRLHNGTVIRNAVRVESPVVQRPPLQSGGPIGIIYVGRITGQKNWQTLITAVEQIGETSDWRLDLYGRGDQEALLTERLRRSAFAERICWHGYTKNALSKIASADLLVLPSWHEGMPNVAAEAMASGTPALLSDIPAHRQLCGSRRCALFFNPNDPARLTRLIQSLTERPQLREHLIHRGHALAMELSPTMMAKLYVNYYEWVRQQS